MSRKQGPRAKRGDVTVAIAANRRQRGLMSCTAFGEAAA
jgi:hypothetical protein